MIGNEKEKSEVFKKKIGDTDFEILLARPPLGKYELKTTFKPNWEYVEKDNNERNKELWAEWEQRYSFKDPTKDLIDEAVLAKT